MRRPFVPSALVAGSLVPDVPYYLPFREFVSGTDAHSLTGLIAVDLPLGVALLAIWHGALAPPLASLTPAALRGRRTTTPPPASPSTAASSPRPPSSGAPSDSCPPHPRPARTLRRRIRAASWLIGSLLAGALTHLVWDSFTRTGGAAVRAWSVLDVVVIGPHRVYNVIQYVSSLGGLAVLVWWTRRRLRRAPDAPGDASGAGAPSGAVGPDRAGGPGDPGGVEATPPRAQPVPRAVGRAVRAGAAVAAGAGAAVGALSPQAAASDYDMVRAALIGGTTGLVLAVAVFAAGWWAARLIRRVTAGCSRE